MFIASTKDKVYHYPNCKCVHDIHPSTRIQFLDKETAESSGYTKCTHCSYVSNCYYNNKKQIDRFIATHGLSVNLDEKNIYIENGPYAWKITEDDDSEQLVLYHANTESYFKLEKKDGRILHHYHLQKYRGKKTIMAMLEYIISHDIYKRESINNFRTMPKTTKRKRKAYRKAKKKASRTKIRNVYNLLDKVKVEEENKKKNK